MNKIIFTAIFIFHSLCGLSQQKDKCTQVFEILDKAKDVCEAFPAQDHCNVFVGMAVREMYGIDDFHSEKSRSNYYRANQVVDLLFTTLSDKWESLGTCDQQDVLNKAQDYANSNRCVIAAWKNPVNSKPGHVALILPGTLKAGWNGMMVPNAANFAQDAPENNFVCDKLSGAFGKDKKANTYLFVHKD